MTQAGEQDIIVAVCTYNRNQDLENLLGKVYEYQSYKWKDFRIGFTIIDDSMDGLARPVADMYQNSFPLGLAYKNSASRNISIARNLALSESMHRAGWIAMTDDDCEPSEQWLPELARVRRATGADVSTGMMLRRAPPHAPAWIRKQPFLELGEAAAKDGEELPIAFTNNSLISSAFLIAHPDLRFDPDFGRIGGEDMAFFHSLKSAGAKIVFAANAFVYENEPEERLTLRYQIRRHFWHGNSSVHTSLVRGMGRGRLVVHAGATLVRGAARPLLRMARGSEPQFLYALAQMAEGFGKLAGTVGIRVKHK